MKTLLIGATLGVLVCAPAAPAVDLHDDQLDALVYYRVPFGAKTRGAREHEFGLMLRRRSAQVDGPQPAAVDLRLGRTGVRALDVHGSNVLPETGALGATADGAGWAVIAMGAVAIVGVGILVRSLRDDDCEVSESAHGKIKTYTGDCSDIGHPPLLPF